MQTRENKTVRDFTYKKLLFPIPPTCDNVVDVHVYKILSRLSQNAYISCISVVGISIFISLPAILHIAIKENKDTTFKKNSYI